MLHKVEDAKLKCSVTLKSLFPDLPQDRNTVWPTSTGLPLDSLQHLRPRQNCYNLLD
jgi:hypothetical protein